MNPGDRIVVDWPDGWADGRDFIVRDLPMVVLGQLSYRGVEIMERFVPGTTERFIHGVHEGRPEEVKFILHREWCRVLQRPAPASAAASNRRK